MNFKKLIYLPLAMFLTLSVSCGDSEVKPEEDPVVDPSDDEPSGEGEGESGGEEGGEGGEDSKTDIWPTLAITEFLTDKGLVGSVPAITVYEDELLDASVVESDYTYFSIIIRDNKANEYKSKLTSSGYILKDGRYTKDDITITVGYASKTTINIYASNDLVVPDEQEDTAPEVDTISKTLSIKDDFGKVDNLHGKQINVTPFLFDFSIGDGTVNPKSTKDNGGYIALYIGNTMKITSPTNITKIEFTISQGTYSADIGELKNNVWTGNAKVITFTSSVQTRFTGIKITYVDPESAPVVTGTVTIKEVYDLAKEITYVPNASGWYLSNVTVTVQVEAIDAIDSVTTANLDGDARGKSLVVDKTGYIICSSGTNTNDPISFYQRVKQYLKAGTTQYVVTGNIAFFNGVVEIKVSSYRYNSSISIDKDYDNYIESTFTKQSELVDDIVNNVTTNKNGYGVHDIVRFNGLTYFNKYNDKGSYLFLDQEGKIVPVYSLLNKDRSYLEKGHVYDIIGYESMYNNRPSLRILKVIRNDELEPKEYDINHDVTHVTDLTQFYNIGFSSTDTKYIKSELTVYCAEVYVSRYANDKYTINTSYYYDKVNKEYTTGNSKNDACNRKALGVFNDNLDYNLTLVDYVLELAKSEEEANGKIVELYFTLAYRDSVDGKNMWRVNILEDYVPQL